MQPIIAAKIGGKAYQIFLRQNFLIIPNVTVTLASIFLAVTQDNKYFVSVVIEEHILNNLFLQWQEFLARI